MISISNFLAMLQLKNKIGKGKKKKGSVRETPRKVFALSPAEFAEPG